MKRRFTSYRVSNFTETKTRMLNWVKQFSIFCFLDNHKYNFSFPSFECLLAAGTLKRLEMPAGKAFYSLQQFKQENNDWLFGHFSYDLKNEIEHLFSANIDKAKFPDIFFFIPQILLILDDKELKIGVIDLDPDKIFNEIFSSPKNINPDEMKIPSIKSRFTKKEYFSCLEQLHKHITRGDCYEINFCQEFFADNAVIDPLHVYHKLSILSPNPFSALYKLEHRYLLCASPERYLKKIGNKIYSQPIKGTSKRALNNSLEDESSKQNLLNSTKERSENVMIVDLVRNDLSQICIEGSVKVEELFGIYSFPQVHQMISTVSGELKNITGDFTNIFRATFPMGSMTGAPKKRVMELIELYEKTKRGIFSGALGYITPEDDFDFNVVIRSISYNAPDKYLSIQAGSAITFNSDAEKEYEECLLKIDAMKSALQ
ncbi:MAG: anthranilate synthase component I family protein [Ginsengibacter sp.]